MPKKLTQEEFIRRAKEVHGDKYDYSKVNYVNSFTNVCIICKRHGEFWQTPSNHLISKGCKKCARINNRGKILGVGIYDVDEYMNHDKSYILWTHMIARCYNIKEQTKDKSYKGCSVCDEWLTFSNFKKWFEDPANGYKEGYSLDKDILVKGNRVYSPDTCCFVPREINNLLTHRKCNKGAYPIGVSFIASKKKYIACVAIDGKNKTIGHYDNPQEAFSAYKQAKEARILDMANKHRSGLTQKVYNALCAYRVEEND